MPELTAPVVLKDQEKRIVYGPVLIPDKPDSDGDIVTADRIEQVAHQFVANYGNIDLEHSLNNVGSLVESYILPMDLPVDQGRMIPKGSWMMGVKVTDDAAWDSVKNGELAGFSIMAVRDAAATKSGDEASKEQQRITIDDLGDEWIVNAVSLVGNPAVPDAKFLAIKSAGPEAQPVALSSLENMLKSKESAPARKDIDVDEEQLKQILEEYLNPLREQVNNIAQQLGDAANTSENSADESASKNADAAPAGDAGGDAGATGQGEAPPAPPEQPQDPASAAPAAQGDESSTGQGEAPQDPAQGDEGEELSEADKAKMFDQLIEHLTANNASTKSVPFSNRITGQDGASTKSETPTNPEPDRDIFGRKIRTN